MTRLTDAERETLRAEFAARINLHDYDGLCAGCRTSPPCCVGSRGRGGDVVSGRDLADSTEAGGGK